MAEVYADTDCRGGRPPPRPELDVELCIRRVSGRQDVGRHVRGQPGVAAGGSGRSEDNGLAAGPAQAWAACRSSLRDPADAMPEYVRWLKSLPGKPVLAHPAAYDFMFVYWYLIRFAGESPFSHSALDIKSFAMAVPDPVSGVGQAEHAARVVRRPAAHPRGARRREGTRGVVLQHARGPQPGEQARFTRLTCLGAGRVRSARSFGRDTLPPKKPS